ncbi:putative fungistatic metabolite [Mycena venus]|uniref:Putative fungistatic metabolite n=1 Tax=Mycena venus TaxID=2733690 RepID=A0A8H7CLH6_9AGAR|nr:putative fungistatic metabolite [Mycena venus]
MARSSQSFVSVVLSALVIVASVEAQLTSWSPSDLLHSFTRRSSITSRAAVVLPPNWTSYGCVREPNSGRALTGYSFTSSSMTITSCVAKCDSLGFKYAGAEYANECYCGNSFEGGDTGGGSLDSGACTMNCAGDATQQCGAGFRLSSYAKQSNVTVAPMLPSGWNYTGCVSEPNTGRTLTNYSFTDPNMTVDKCVATCNSKGFHIAGAEYSSECYCGDAFQATATGGGTSMPDSDCSMQCAGESTQKCGGGNRLSIYSKPQTTTPSGPTLPTGWSYIACTQEPSNGRLLTGYSFTSASLTVESCISTCKSRGFSYAGMEYANECYCGTGYAVPAVKAPETECSMACAGSTSEKCGAGYRLSVYSSEPASNSNLILPAFWSKTSKCIIEASTGRTLSGNSLVDGGMTVEKCVNLCDSTGFIYAGLEFANECYCDNTISLANGGGVPANSANECNMPCAGNSAEICGAGFRITMYTKGNSTSAALPAGWSPSMCAVDNPSRVLTGHQSTETALTPASCITKCAGLGFTLSGVENGNECYCGNILTNNPVGARDSQCSTPCAGDASQNCGGGYRMMIYQKDAAAPSGPNAWKLTAGGTSGVVMTHVAVVNSETILVIDRKENNPLLNANHLPAWGGVWSLVDNTARALNLETHSFCSAGSFLGNGTLVNFGGQPYINRDGEAAPDGQQGIRLYNGCPASGTCDIYEDATRVRMASNRWYPTSARLPDGSAIILGGAQYSGWTNSEEMNNPTYEFYPVKNINGQNGLPIPSKFFNDTLPHNTVRHSFPISPPSLTPHPSSPHVYSLPSGKLFVAANNQAMLLDWQSNIETRLPNFPNGQRVVYPLNAAAVLLPLTPENNYTPEVVICGGSQISDKTASEDLDAQHDYGSAQCSRMVLNDAGIAAGWQVEWMPEPRLMSEGTLLPDGKVLIINGCRTGTAGYGNLQNRIGNSNADHPTFTPLLYDPSAPTGSRFTRDGLPTSNIPRMYHSVATLLPSGAIMIGGSNPNDDVSTQRYASEYRVEYLYPSYMTKTRPTFSGVPSHIGYNSQFALNVTVPSGAKDVYAIVMDFGFVTHSVHMDQKLVKLVSVWQGNQLTATGPPNANIFSPGPGWVIVMADGVPSVAQQVMVGSGANPPEDDAAIANMLASTKTPSSGPD